MSDTSDRPEGDGTAPGLSRRGLIVTAGKTAALGAALTTGGVALPAAAVGAAGEGAVASGPKGAAAFEFVGQILQNGGHMEGYGFVTEAAGLDDTWLFADPAHVAEHSEQSARLTVFGEVTLQSRTARANVFVLDAIGGLAVHLQDVPGADFGDLASFTAGRVVARYSMRLRDVLTVIAPNEGIPTLTGELTQVEASGFSLNGRSRKFGTKGMRLTLEGTGHGVRQQADPPIATIDLAARLTVA